MSRFAAFAISGLAAAAFGLAMLASAPVSAETYRKETVECKKGMVYDKKKKKCVKAQSHLTPDTVLSDNAYRRAVAVAKGYTNLQ
jgi:hypothetical protein